jgi:hypothetical protein
MKEREYGWWDIHMKKMKGDVSSITRHVEEFSALYTPSMMAYMSEREGG